MKKTALIFILFLAFQVFAQESKVATFFTVLDENKNFISDIKASDVAVSAGKTKMQNVVIQQVKHNNLDIILMIDVSMSQEKVLPLVKEIADKFIDSIPQKDNDRIGIVKFTGETTAEQILSNNFSTAKEKVRNLKVSIPKGTIGGISIGQNPRISDQNSKLAGSTSIWDSIINVSQNNFLNDKKDTKKVIILFTDGFNTFGESKIKHAVENAVKSNITVYSFGIGDDNFNGVDVKSVEQISEETGGLVYTPRSVKDLKNLAELFKELEQSLRFGYKVIFDAGKSDNLQEIKFKIINSDIRKRKVKIVQNKWFFNPE